jgi:hypothetical protein
MTTKKEPWEDEKEINRKSDEIEKEWDKYRKEREKKKLPYKNIKDWLKEKKQKEKAKNVDWPDDQDPIIVFAKAKLDERTVGVFDSRKGEGFGDSDLQPTIAISHKNKPVLLRPLNKKAAKALMNALQEWIDLQTK